MLSVYGKVRFVVNKDMINTRGEGKPLAGSPSQSKPVGFASSPKVGALGSPRKLHLFAKASPFEERLPPRRGKMSHSDKKGSVDLRSKDGEGEDACLRTNPLRLTAFASSPKGTPLGNAGNFAAAAKSRPLGEGGLTRSGKTEGVSSLPEGAGKTVRF